MWVDIANLMGPRGEAGQDGTQGPPGPVNIGLDPNGPISWDQTGGFTFNFVDGSEQTVNLPIASAQSAGLLASGGQMPGTGLRNVTDLVVSGPVVAGAVMLCRVGPIVTVTTRDFRINSTGWRTLLTLPRGFRPLVTVESSAWWTTSGGLFQCIANQNGVITLMHPGESSTVRGHFTFATTDPWPTQLPGTDA